MSDLCFSVPYWDTHQWNRFVQATPKAQDAIAIGSQKIFSFPQFTAETFHRLYSLDATPIESPKPEAEWAVKLHEELSQNQDFLDLQNLVGGNYYLAGLAASSFLQEIAYRLPEPKEPVPDPQEVRQQVLGQKRLGDKADLGLIQSLVQEGKQAVQAAQDYANGLDAMRLSTLVSKAAQSGSQSTQETLQQVEGMGWGLGPGTGSCGGTVAEKMQLAAKLAQSCKLRQIAKQAGRLKHIAAAKQQNKSKDAHHTITSVETGANVTRLLPSQAVMLKDPTLKPLFLKGMTEKSLLQYQMGGKDRLGRGPVVACLDSSSSMEGEYEVWSKAVCLALLGIAIMQKRHFRLIHFSGRVERTDDFLVGENDQKAQNRLLQSLEFFSGGGTSWTYPLDAALDAIRGEKALNQADIVLITDGECNVRDTWLQSFKASQQELEFHCYGVLIGHENDNELKQVMDTVIRVANLHHDQAIAEVFAI